MQKKSVYINKCSSRFITFLHRRLPTCQKWLKDRKGRILSMDDIFHYQKIIVALTETDRLMKEVNQIEIE